MKRKAKCQLINRNVENGMRRKKKIHAFVHKQKHKHIHLKSTVH